MTTGKYRSGEGPHSLPRLIGGSTLAMALAVALFIVGCGDGDDNEATRTERPQPTATPTAAVTGPASFATPEIDGGTYRFVEKGYAIDVPEGWRVEPNYVFEPAGSEFPQDVLFHPDVIEEVQPSVAISCLKLREDQSTTEEFRDTRALLVAEFAGEEVVPREVQIDNLRAFAFDYQQSLRERTGEDVIAEIEKTDVVFVDDECRWLIVFTAPGGHRDQYEPAFEEVIDSFRLLE